MGSISTALGGLATAGIAPGLGQSLMDRASLAPDTATRQKLVEGQMAAALDAERARYEALQEARPNSSAGLGALNAYYARLNAAAERVKQTEASYQKMYGALPAEIQKLGIARVSAG